MLLHVVDLSRAEPRVGLLCSRWVCLLLEASLQSESMGLLQAILAELGYPTIDRVCPLLLELDRFLT